MAQSVPTLSIAGFVSGVREKMDTLLSYYFVSEHSQSNTYRGRIASLPYQIQQFGNDPTNLKQVMEDSLRGMLGRYFDAVTVDIDVNTPRPEDPNRVAIRVDIVVTQDGTTYSAGRLLNLTAGKLANIVNINNNIGQPS
jgi:hypothetical protein